MHSPTTTHVQALKHLLRYLKGTFHYGLLLRRDSPLQLHAFTDADWAGDKDTFHSTTGYIVNLGCNPIACRALNDRRLLFVLPLRLSLELQHLLLSKFFG